MNGSVQQAQVGDDSSKSIKLVKLSKHTTKSRPKLVALLEYGNAEEKKGRSKDWV